MRQMLCSAGVQQIHMLRRVKVSDELMPGKAEQSCLTVAALLTVVWSDSLAASAWARSICARTCIRASMHDVKIILQFAFCHLLLLLPAPVSASP